MVKKLSILSTNSVTAATNALNRQLQQFWETALKVTRSKTQVPNLRTQSSTAAKTTKQATMNRNLFLRQSNTNSNFNSIGPEVQLRSFKYNDTSKHITTRKRLPTKQLEVVAATATKRSQPKRVKFSSMTTTISSTGSKSLTSACRIKRLQSKVLIPNDVKIKSILKPNKLNVQTKSLYHRVLVHDNDRMITSKNPCADRRAIILEELRQKYTRIPRTENSSKKLYSVNKNRKPVQNTQYTSIRQEKKKMLSKINRDNDVLDKLKQFQKQFGINPAMVQDTNEKKIRVTNTIDNKKESQRIYLLSDNNSFRTINSGSCNSDSGVSITHNGSYTPDSVDSRSADNVNITTDNECRTYESIDESNRQETNDYCISDENSKFDSENNFNARVKLTLLAN